MEMEERKPASTFISKTDTECPVCGHIFRKEEMMTGGGRLNAGDLTTELRRLYIPSKKYGEINPLIYYITVCPQCFYAANNTDFSEVNDEMKEKINLETEERETELLKILPGLDFSASRSLIEGVASYYYAMKAANHFPKSMSPSIKSGIYSLRAAWLCNDLHAKNPSENYDYLASLFYRKARFFYVQAIAGEQDGSETMSGLKNLGPDLDKNYGYDGALYMTAYLEYKFCPPDDPAARAASLANAKKTIARIFGMGKASKNKPAAILDNSKDLFDKIKTELKEADE